MPNPPHDDRANLNDANSSEGRFRTIGEVAAETGIKAHVLRYWEDNFPMLRPLKRAGGRRYYRVEDVALIRRIDDLLHHKGYTLAGARLELSGKSAPIVDDRTSLTALSPSARTKLKAVRDTLVETLAEVQRRD